MRIISRMTSLILSFGYLFFEGPLVFANPPVVSKDSKTSASSPAAPAPSTPKTSTEVPSPLTANLDSNGVILQGYDAVSYFKDPKPAKGLASIQSQYRGVTYLFASELNKATFVKDPEHYVPQFGGWCAYAVADSKSKVDIDPTSFLIQDGRLLVFYNGLWGNTREKWQKGKGSADYLREADRNWFETKTKAP